MNDCLSRVITNKYLLKHPGKDSDVEWGYAFDVHLNAFYPLLVILHFLQLCFINRKHHVKKHESKCPTKYLLIA